MSGKVLFLFIVALLPLPSAYAATSDGRVPTPAPTWGTPPPKITPPPPHLPPVRIPPIDVTTEVTEQISRSVNSSVAQRAMFANLVIPELKVRNFSGRVNQMKFSIDKRYVSFFLEDGSIRVWDFDSGIQRAMVFNQLPKRMALDIKQQALFVATSNGIESYDIFTSQHLKTLPVSGVMINDMDASADGLLLVTAGKSPLSFQQNRPDVMLAANPQTPDVSEPLTQANPDKSLKAFDSTASVLKWEKNDFSGTPDKLSISPDNRYFAVVCHEAGGKSDVLEIRDLSNGKKLQTFLNSEQSIIFSQFSSNNSIEVGYGNGETKIWNVENGALLASRTVSEDVVAMDKMGENYVYLLNDGNVIVTNAQGNKLASINNENNPIRSITLLAQGKRLLTTTENGQVLLWNVGDGAQLLQMISTKQGWTVVDNAGRFDGSEPAMPNVFWQAEGREFPIDNTSNGYYEPGLLATTLNNDSYLTAKPFAIPQGIVLPPTLQVAVNNATISPEDVELTVDIYDQGGGIEAVNVYHNNKAIVLQRAVVSDKTVKEQDQEKRSLVIKLKPTAGENQVKVRASNKMGIENQSNEAFFNVNVSAQPPVLRVATVGINQYSDKKLDLDYSVADAKAIEQILTQRRNRTHFSETNKKELYDQKASKAAILSTLRELSQGAQQDVLAVYLAGHGISINGDWYFLPYETTASSNLNYFAGVGISAQEISDIFKDSTVQQILLMVDSCYSGAGLDSFKKLQNTQRRFSRALSRSVGITIVTATRQNQQAAELTELGHGLFTYILEKGMRGEADFMPQNNQISAHELVNFSLLAIPNFAKRYSGVAQDPSAFTMGQDFILFNH